MFAQPDQTGPILGDLAEEFAEITTGSNSRRARRWYRGQAIRTVLAILSCDLRSSTWTIAAAACAGYLLLLISNQLVEIATAALLEAFTIYSYIGARLVWWIYAIGFERIACPVFAGWITAALARKRAMSAGVALAAMTAVLGANIPACGGLLGLPVVLANADQIRHYLPNVNIVLFALGAMKLAWAPPLGVMIGAALRRKQTAFAQPRIA
jgi:hypothetical protein